MREDEIAVSVLITSFNHEDFISQALDSVLSQQVDFNYEIVIGDDASTDRTPDIIEEYVNKYPNIFQFIKREKNIGATRNSYELNLICRGNYIAVLEADDYWIDSHKLQKQKQFLDFHPEYLGCSTGLIYVNKNGDTLSHYKIDWYRPKKKFTLLDYDGFHLPAQTSTYMRRNIFKSPQFDYSVMYLVHPQVGDRICAAVYLLHGDFYYLNEKMSAYRIPLGRKNNGTNLIFSHRLSAMQTDFALYNAQKKLLAQHGKKLKSDYSARRIFYSSMISFLKTGDVFFKKMAGDILRDTDNVLRTYILFVPFIMGRIRIRLTDMFYMKKSI